MSFKVFETTFAGRKLVVETGKMCALSNGSCLVRYGDTAVLANVTMSQKPRPGIDFFPLSVDFEEKIYAVGRIPGSFMRREGRPAESAVLSSRMVDRPMRPLFPKDMRNDVSIVMTVMSVDQDCSPEIAGMLGAIIATCISNVPFNGPIGGISVGLVDDEIVLMPSEEQRKNNKLELTLVCSKEKVVMIEAGAAEVPEDVMMEAIKAGHVEIKKFIEFVNEIVAEIGKPKFDFQPVEVDHDMFEAVKAFAIEKVRAALDTDDKNVREERLSPVYTEVHEKFDAEYPEQEAMLDECMYKLQKFVVRRWLLDDGKRVDGRGINEIRPLSAEVGLLPRVHGSGMFTRGQTQVLTVATLGSSKDGQLIDGLQDVYDKKYMHQYNFPPYSVGESRPLRSPGRREIGHGALAERALVPVLPRQEDFPYTIRLVSEILSSNGSTSQGAICASTLALMDAGVPITAPVAGISVGLITEDDRWMTMLDIQGLEDFFGDMDFKVGGTHKGITAIQVDIKVDGLTYEIIAEAFEKCRKARIHIIDDVMLKAIPEVRKELSQYAPKMKSIKIDPEKIKDVIGKGGKIIQKICAECDVTIDIDDDGTVYVSGIDSKNVEKALAVIGTIVFDPEVGAIYKGVVTRLMNFGAFVEIAPGKEGLVHISKLDDKRVEKVEDVVNVGDEVFVKVTEIDDQKRINLSRKDALAEIAAKKAKEQAQ
ncbi:MAG: polyribonucleotide nucleotidyltransferase [Oscillospiraceae bacterium]